MYTLGIDIGSSSVKVSLLDVAKGKSIASDFFPKKEMEITAIQAGWAEQHPDMWWKNMSLALESTLEQAQINRNEIKAIGISYQMHGLVCIDKEGNVLRPSIIWCDSRAVEIGKEVNEKLGAEFCLENFLNSPGNFTASKLKWVKDNEPELYEKIDKIMLPGDYMAYKLTGVCGTTISGLSEGILWNFKQNEIALDLLKEMGIGDELLPEILENFTPQGELLPAIAEELGLPAGIPVSYRAGDQPNNAFSLNVLNPGEVAATAGTSGVVYGVSDLQKYDDQSRVNTFAHVNHTVDNSRLGILLCINGTGILNSWLRKNICPELSYEAMNDEASKVAPGSDGLNLYPFGNGAERVLGNQNPGASFKDLNFNIHSRGHILRAAQEGIAFSFKYGMDIMKDLGINMTVIKAGKANMFLSPIFRETLANVTVAKIELYDTDGAEGAARGAALGAGIYNNLQETFASLNKLEEIYPEEAKREEYQQIYTNWKTKV
ncbi:carbohydrate kinase [Puteibacter caeruleilacunae]|nr:carbohydrate kinase [Puteibacter caeruleilacunae]